MYLQIGQGMGQLPMTAPPSRVVRSPLDAKARAIIAATQDTDSPIESRARRAVWYILYNYYHPEVGKVSAVIFNPKEKGLRTQRVGQGAGANATIAVGRCFIEQTTDRYFARRVLQVGHELQHINQYRAGMIGEAKQDEREFLAFYWEATTAEKPGTGRLSHSTRVDLIDAALGYLNCLNQTNQVKYTQHRSQLLHLRPTHQAASGRPATTAPTVCSRQR